MAEDRTTFTRDEILETDAGLAPLFANDLRCHGGFDDAGAYRSPRTLHRTPAIRAWQARLERDGAALVAIDPALIPPQVPSLEQAKLLLAEGVTEPIVRALTLVSIVEGFGATIRDVPIPDLREQLREPFDGTALAHLGALMEAHARDEAGHKDEGGHKQMWEAARDLALDKPRVPSDMLMRLLGRRRGDGPARDGDDERAYPPIDPALERLLMTMTRVLVIEVFAARTFDWGERLLSDPAVSARPREAGAMVAYIRKDEAPHVEYLRTALSEVRARSVRTASGAFVPGRVVVDGILHATLSQVIARRPAEQREAVRSPLREAIDKAGKPDALLEAFDALEPSWTPPARTGFEPAAA